MQLYLALLKSFLDGKVFKRYYQYLNQDFLDKNYPEVGRVFKTLPTLHSSGSDDVFGLVDLQLSFYKDFPKADHGFYDRLFTDLKEVNAQPEQVVSYLEESRKRQIALDTAKLALRAAEGLGDLSEVAGKLSEAGSFESAYDRFASRFVNESLQELYESQFKKPGLRWRLKSLNMALGSLRLGDFGFVFARPETGKTTFLASEASFMAGQADRPVVWFNNEEQGGKVKSRCYQATLGLTNTELYGNIAENEARYQELTQGRLQIYNEASISKLDVEAICAEYKPALIIFDQIDKIKGFQADRNDLELKELYAWGREIAKQYGPVIGVCQAGASGEDKMWLTMNDVDSSKTSKQGEADWILGIGKVHQPGHEYVRYMCLSKNKLQGDEDTDNTMRHGKWSCFIKPEIARYMDFNDNGSLS